MAWRGVAYHLIMVTNRQSTWIETSVKFERAPVVYNQVFMLQQFFFVESFYPHNRFMCDLCAQSNPGYIGVGANFLPRKK